MLTLPNYGNETFGNILIHQIVCIFTLLVTLATSSTTTNDMGQKNIIETSSSLTAQGIATAFSTLSPSSPLPIFSWGHVTKYSSILFDADIFVKASITVDVKYPSNDDTNVYTIIGIYARNKLDSTSVPNTSSNDLTIFPIYGGIGYNYTTIRFISNSNTEYKYNLIVYGVNV